MDAPMLTSRTDLDRLGFDVRTLSGTLHLNDTEHNLTLTDRGFIVLSWNNATVCNMYTIPEF